MSNKNDGKTDDLKGSLVEKRSVAEAEVNELFLNSENSDKLSRKVGKGVAEVIATEAFVTEVVGDFATEEFVTDAIAAIPEPVPTSKFYKALITQSGTDAPTATVIQNDFNGDLTWSYDFAGQYILNCTGTQFTTNKTVCYRIGGGGAINPANLTTINSYPLSFGNNTIVVNTVVGGAFANDILNGHCIIVEVVN